MPRDAEGTATAARGADGGKTDGAAPTAGDADGGAATVGTLTPDLQELGEIIRAYSAATAELQQSHELLQSQVMQLSGELRQKNQELSATVTQVSSLKNYLAGIIQSSADGIVAIDLDRRIMAWNPAVDRLLAGLGDPAPAQPEGGAVDAVLTGEAAAFAGMLVRSLEEQRSFSGVEIRLVDATGRTRYFSASASPVRSAPDDGDARTVGAVLIFSDQTAIRELEDRANRQDRLAALGEMAAGVAHEIRNPLGGIELYASSLRRKFPEDSGEYATCGKIIAAATSLNRIVSDMLTLTRGRPPHRRKALGGQVPRSAVDLAARELAEREVQAELAPDDPGRTWVLDPDQLVQACLNVILNAAQVTEPGGTIRIASAEGVAADGKPWLDLYFADEGPGIPEAAKAKIFDPFFTLRKDGTGLGLAIVHKIIEDHGGSIDVMDNVPRGTRVRFRLPAAAPDPASADPSDSDCRTVGFHYNPPRGDGVAGANWYAEKQDCHRR
ncbi:MAG: PAS domain-containing protein [Planctomycetes bacterium]|nr:PAS domain-containing protein [Planctomycetota bacterium]